MNVINIIGNVGKKPELQTSNAGKSYCKFSVGVARRMDKTKTDWFNCTAFGKTAEIIAQYVDKGHKIGVTGEIQFGSFKGNDGTTKYTTDLMVNSMDLIGGTTRGPEQQSNAPMDFSATFNDADLPF